MRALKAAEKPGFVSGHDFSRAVMIRLRRALAPEVRLSSSADEVSSYRKQVIVCVGIEKRTSAAKAVKLM